MEHNILNQYTVTYNSRDVNVKLVDQSMEVKFIGVDSAIVSLHKHR